MITSLPKLGSTTRRGAAFTLVEVMIASTLATVVLAGVLTAFIQIARSGVRVANYSEMETQTRRAFEQLAIDARMANSFTANFTAGAITSFILTVPNPDDLLPNRVLTYGYDASDSSNRKFFVQDETGVRTNLISNIEDLQVLRYNATSTLIPAATVSSAGIKHVQVSVSIKRSGGGVNATTQVIRSSAFTFRNM